MQNISRPERPGLLRATKIIVGIGLGLGAALALASLPFTLSAILATVRDGFGSIGARAELGIIFYVVLHVIWAALMTALLPGLVFSFLNKGKPLALCIPFWFAFAINVTQFVVQVVLIYATPL